MIDWAPLQAVLLGFFAGLFAAMPGGPVNATILGEAAHKGFRWVCFVAMGATVMEAIYCSAAFAGFSQLFDSRWVRAAMELISFLLMLWLGIKYLRGTPLPGEQRAERFVEEHFHPHTAFWTGFLRVLGNPGILLLWLTVSAPVLNSGWVRATWDCKWPFIGGAAGGGLIWFLLLGWSVSRGRGRFSPKTMGWLTRASGILLIALAVGVGVRLVMILAPRE
jgi:threonine/homoserine/homoserine lactone efflux protein